MKNIKLKTALLLIVGLSIIIFFILIAINNDQMISLLGALKIVPKIVSIDIVIIGVFSTYLWKWKIFSGWLVPFPNLNGTWKGEILSTWVDPVTNARPLSIPATLTIKQSFFRVSCVMRTGEMRSISCIADFILDKENQIKRLCYTYDSNPISTVRERSPQHCGTQIFDIIDGDIRKLSGEYWTGRKTTGQIEVVFWKKELISHYPKDLGQHPVSVIRNNIS